MKQKRVALHVLDLSVVIDQKMLYLGIKVNNNSSYLIDKKVNNSLLRVRIYHELFVAC